MQITSIQLAYRRCGAFLLAVMAGFLLASSAAPVTVLETFNNLNASTTTTTQSGSFVGVNGTDWDYAFVRKVSGLINGTSVELNRNGRGLLKTTLPNGISTLRYKVRTLPDKWHTTAKVRVFINGTSYGVRNPSASNAVTTITIDNIDLSGTVTVELKSVGSLEAIIDDVEITSFGTSSTPSANGESFTNLDAPAGGNLGAGSYVGDNGQTWTYERAGAANSGITGRSIVLRKHNGLLQTTIPEAITSMQFSIRTRAGGGNTSGRVRVTIGGNTLGEYGTTVSEQVETYTIDNVAAAAGSDLTIQGIGYDNTLLDDLTWTGTAPPPGGGPGPAPYPGPSPGPNDLAIDVQGWSVVSPSSDSRIVYCSHSQGNDANSGLSVSSPVKTLNKAFSLLRNGYPDHLYLKRGDVWTDQTFVGLKDRSGRSGTERLVVSYYGSSGSRPRVKTNNRSAMPSASLNHVAIIGVEFYNYTVDPGNDAFVQPDSGAVKGGFSFVTKRVRNLLFEDCKFSFYSYHLSFFFQKDYALSDGYINIDLRRNILLNAYQQDATDNKVKSQGIFISHATDILFEENFFDHNGWNASLPGAQANQFNHNIYMSTDNDGPIVVRGNVISRGAAHGLQLRSGGTAEFNAFIGNAVGMNLGYSSKPTHFTGQTSATNNVFTDGRPQRPNDTSFPQTGAIWGVWRQLIDNVTVSDNIVANIDDTDGGNMKPYNGMTANEFGSGNIAWNWVKGSVPATNPGWLDPNRDKDSYATSEGYGNYDEWVRAAANRAPRSFPAKFTARNYVEYIRAGFSTGSNLTKINTTSPLHTAEAKSVAANLSPTYRIYPNPTSEGSVTVESTGITLLRVMSIEGRILRRLEHPASRTNLDLGGVPGGLYIIELIGAEDYRKREKLVVR